MFTLEIKVKVTETLKMRVLSFDKFLFGLRSLNENKKGDQISWALKIYTEILETIHKSWKSVQVEASLHISLLRERAWSRETFSRQIHNKFRN